MTDHDQGFLSRTGVQSEFKVKPSLIRLVRAACSTLPEGLSTRSDADHLDGDYLCHVAESFEVATDRGQSRVCPANRPPGGSRGRSHEQIHRDRPSPGPCSEETHDMPRRRVPLLPAATAILRGWFLACDNRAPYPTPTEKARLASRAGLTVRQVSTWLVNARSRVWVRPQGLPRSQRSSSRLTQSNTSDGKSASEHSGRCYPSNPVAAVQLHVTPQSAGQSPPTGRIVLESVATRLRARKCWIQAELQRLDRLERALKASIECRELLGEEATRLSALAGSAVS